MIYDVGHRNPIPVPPPPEPDVELISSLGVPHRADRRDPRPHAPQVRRSRRRDRLDGLDELDGRLVVAAGERDRDRRVGRSSRRASRKNFEELWSKGDRRAERLRRAESRARRRDTRMRAWFTPGLRRGALAPDREAHPAREAARADLLAGADRRARCLSALARADRRRASTSPAASTARRSRASSTSGASTATRPGSCRSCERALDGAVLGQAVDAVGHRARARLHAREDHGRRRRRLHAAATTCRARASRTRRTCWRSRTRRSPSVSPASSTRCAPAIPRFVPA